MQAKKRPLCQWQQSDWRSTREAGCHAIDEFWRVQSWLFGSYAKEKANKRSGIDLPVLVGDSVDSLKYMELERDSVDPLRCMELDSDTFDPLRRMELEREPADKTGKNIYI